LGYRAGAVTFKKPKRIVIEKPARKRGLLALLKTMKPVEEDFPEIDDPVPMSDNDQPTAKDSGPGRT
jgi:antitoxin VapB